MIRALDLLDLQMIRAIADTGSITGAAGVLGYSQPAVTQRLRRAERDLGQPLVLRGGRGVTLTEAGRRLAQHAVRVQTALDAATHDLDELAGAASGTLRLAGFPSASPTLVPALLAELGRRHPLLTVGYVEAEPPEALELLRDGAVDLALTFSFDDDGPGTLDEDAPLTLTTTPLYRDTTVVAAPTGTLPDAAVDLRDLASLEGARFIGGCPRCRGHLMRTCARAGFTPDIVLETDNSLAVLSLVAQGLGVALLPALSLVPAVVPAGVETRALPSHSDRIVTVSHTAGAERVPAVREALRVLHSLDAAAFGLQPAS